VASGGALDASTAYGLTFAYGDAHKRVDPTIINVDPPIVVVLPEGRRDAAGNPAAIRAVA
jgi:hypothetical protein